MMDNGNDQQIDVGSVVEAVSADHSFGAPLYVVESLCMRCGENVCLSFSLTDIYNWLVSLFVAEVCVYIHSNIRDQCIGFTIGLLYISLTYCGLINGYIVLILCVRRKRFRL